MWCFATKVYRKCEFLGLNMNLYERYSKLKQFFELTFPDAVCIKDDVDINKIKQNKLNLINEAKEKVSFVA